jgi:hypothetical protein
MSTGLHRSTINRNGVVIRDAVSEQILPDGAVTLRID